MTHYPTMESMPESYREALRRLADELLLIADEMPERILLDLTPLLSRESPRSAERRIAAARTAAAQELVDADPIAWGAQVRLAKRLGMSEQALSRVLVGRPRSAGAYL